VSSLGSKGSDRRVAAKTDLATQAKGLSMGNEPSNMTAFASATDNRLSAAAMGPGEPARPFPLGGEPRQMQYRVGWNFPSPPDTDRGIGSNLLRSLADSCDLVRRCIEIRKAELCALDWDIVPSERQASKSKQLINDTMFLQEVNCDEGTPNHRLHLQGMAPSPRNQRKTLGTGLWPGESPFTTTN
jgi:hypothetical protein